MDPGSGESGESRRLEGIPRPGDVIAGNFAVDYVLQACDGVAHAHALGIVHRDLKPANLFLSGSVAVTNTPLVPKYYPQVIFDGRSLVVSWIEFQSPAYVIQFARFGTGLAPIGATQCAVGPTCSSGFSAGLGSFGVASAGPNDYGLAFLDTKSYRYHFRHVSCDGP